MSRLARHVGLLGAVLVLSFGPARPDQDEPPSPASKPGVTVTLDEAALARGGIEVAAPPRVAEPQRVPAYGSVLETASLAQVATETAAASARLEAARAKLTASQAGFERARRLFAADQNMSRAELEAATATFHVDEAEAVAAVAAADAARVKAAEAWGPVLASQLADRAGEAGRVLEGHDRLVAVALPGTIAGAAAAATVEGTDIRLTFISVAGHADPQAAGVSRLYAAPADDRLLPGMNVAVSVETGRTVQGLRVPDSAVLSWQGFAWVYVRTGPGRFERRRIDPGLPVEGGYLVPDLPARTEIVVRGADLMLSQELKAQGSAGDTD